MSCKKCGKSSKAITLRKKDTYCEECFLSNVNHKFRACIGKNKILSRNERVLVCASGGQASNALLDLIHFGLSQDSHKMLRIKPVVLHIIDHSNDSKGFDVLSFLTNQCKLYEMELYVIHISQYFYKDQKLLEPYSIPDVNNQEEQRFTSMMNDMHPTIQKDFLFKIKRNLFIKAAENLKCQYVFTGETTTTLAVNLLSNLAIGRGCQVESDIGFCDARNHKVKIIRPMKDITNEELQYYIKTKNLEVGSPSKKDDVSLQSLIQSFVIDLQTNFPATISTVCKTADKIGAQELIGTKNKCALCESVLHSTSQQLTALEATNFSKSVSETKAGISMDFHKINTTSMFPFCNKSLCFSCSRSYSELDKSKIPQHIESALNTS